MLWKFNFLILSLGTSPRASYSTSLLHFCGRGPYLAPFLPCLINQKIGHRVMLRMQTEELPSCLHDGSGKNGIVDVQPMARVPLPIERGRCIAPTQSS